MSTSNHQKNTPPCTGFQTQWSNWNIGEYNQLLLLGASNQQNFSCPSQGITKPFLFQKDSKTFCLHRMQVDRKCLGILSSSKKISRHSETIPTNPVLRFTGRKTLNCCNLHRTDSTRQEHDMPVWRALRAWYSLLGVQSVGSHPIWSLFPLPRLQSRGALTTAGKWFHQAEAVQSP